MKLKKLYPSVISFMLLFPFRLPISVLLILAFNHIANLAGKVVPEDVMCANVVISKLVYNMILGCWFLYSIENLIRKINNGRKALSFDTYGGQKEDRMLYLWTCLIGVLVFAYIIYDGVATYQIFYAIIGKPVTL